MRTNDLTPQDLVAYGITDTVEVVHNPGYEALFRKKPSPV